jgi:hypothetical protein
MDRFQTVREIASAQVRLARALASQLRAHVPWQQALPGDARSGKRRARWLNVLRTGRARPSHAVLADHLAQVQRCAAELALWADRARAERRAAAAERERLESEAVRSREAEVAASARAAEDRRALEALHAEMDGLPTRLHPRYASLEAKARAVHHAVAAAELEADRLSESSARSRHAAFAGRELEAALERAEQTLRQLERAAAGAAEQVNRALGAHAASADARELAELLAAAVKEADPDAVESLAKETFRFLSERADAARHR